MRFIDFCTALSPASASRRLPALLGVRLHGLRLLDFVLDRFRKVERFRLDDRAAVLVVLDLDPADRRLDGFALDLLRLVQPAT